MATPLRQTDKKNLGETLRLWTASYFPTVETRVWHSRFKIQNKGLLGLHTYFVYFVCERCKPSYKIGCDSFNFEPVIVEFVLKN